MKLILVGVFLVALFLSGSDFVSVKQIAPAKERCHQEQSKFQQISNLLYQQRQADSVMLKYSSFKHSILQVFTSYNESSFASIKLKPINSSNFWNYQYTYSTSLKIPGEKFNMLHSFPFVTSPLDFVSIIQQSDNYDPSMIVAYKTFEKKLLENFSLKEGWIALSIPNKKTSKFSDLEFRNDKYSAVILDCSKNPRGKYFPYHRFFLFSS